MKGHKGVEAPKIGEAKQGRRRTNKKGDKEATCLQPSSSHDLQAQQLQSDGFNFEDDKIDANDDDDYGDDDELYDDNGNGPCVQRG